MIQGITTVELPEIYLELVELPFCEGIRIVSGPYAGQVVATIEETSYGPGGPEYAVRRGTGLLPEYFNSLEAAFVWAAGSAYQYIAKQMNKEA